MPFTRRPLQLGQFLIVMFHLTTTVFSFLVDIPAQTPFKTSSAIVFLLLKKISNAHSYKSLRDMATSPRRLAPSPATSITATASLDQHSRSAQAILSSFEELDIIAWLRLLRSIESCAKSRPRNGDLSQSQLNALRWLSSLSSNQAEEWLAQRRAQPRSSFRAVVILELLHANYV